MSPAASLVPPPNLPPRLHDLDTTQLEARAVALAAEHIACERGRTPPSDLLARLEDNRRQLVASYRSGSVAATQGRWMSPASDWLLDNFHVVQEQLREAREDLPRHFARALPKLASGPSAGLPRAFAIAIDIIAAGDGKLDIARLKLFLSAYQTVAPLRLGELWAIPIALRHALLDRLALIAARVEWARLEREAAASLALELSNSASRGPEEVARVLAHRVAPRVLPSTTMFVTELLLRLRDQDPALAEAAAWLERRIEEQGTTLEEASRIEHQSQAANQLSVGNAITSMRTITATDWRAVVEELSLVERVLRQDPSGFYARMDFATRDRYRHVVERVAKRATSNEIDVAKAAIELATDAQRLAPNDNRAAHVGTYLLTRSPALRRRTGHRPALTERARDTIVDHATLFYLGSIPLLAGLGAAFVAWWAMRFFASVPLAVACALLALTPVSEVAVALVNLVITLVLAPRRLPKLDFSKGGIPAAHRTLVVVPTMLSSNAAIDHMLEELEVRFLANREAHLHFALVTDLSDARSAERPDDAPFVARVSAGIVALNDRYGADRFLLLHRHRIWNAGENAFMGWERKRGKLVELNRLLLGGNDTSYSTIVGDRALLTGVRYVLTLDADTRLPRDSARKLVGTMAHPLVAPCFAGETDRIVEGHAMLQPRVSVAFESWQQSRFSRLASDEAGIDPYTTAVSDAYQDLFGQGSFVGKGIYDVRAFQRALGDRVPEQTMLSHDLFEGIFAHSALVSDVELFDDTPSSYVVWGLRRHRWIRGDWQLLPWLGAAGLSAISRWKIFDNLRRSLIEPATLLLFVLASALSYTLAWGCVALVAIVAPIALHFAAALVRLPAHEHRSLYLRNVSVQALRMLARCGLALLFLPHQAWLSVDAIARALYRRAISRKQLLQWVTVAQAELLSGRSVGAAYRAMAPSLVLTSLIAAFLVWRGAWLCVPLPVAWLLAPWVVAWLGRPPRPLERPLLAVDHAYLRKKARRTWAYFERFVTEADHHLPPDNLQEDPRVLARRTSPTNIGLSLLANLVALDLGYIGLCTCVERTEQALSTLDALERHRGHFLNWYDTATTLPLQPRYVSTVDSGNLAAMLLVLKQGCLAELARVPSPALVARGLVDTLRIVDEQLGTGSGPLHDEVTRLIADLEPERGIERSLELPVLHARVEGLKERATLLGADAPIIEWLDALLAQVSSHQRGDTALAPRLTALAARADVLVAAMEFGFLYDTTREVFSIGFDVQAARLDASFYDLLASESRIGSFVAIAKGDVPVSHWFRLGRGLVQVGFGRALLSWTGTMFEYLMPQLIMRSYAGTLIERSNRAVVDKQIAYGRERGVPWGISESAYNARDLHLNYQYGPFGVPGLGLKRGLGEDLVVAPYATALALSIDPRAAVDNLRRLDSEGVCGDYGSYEAVDFTPSRVPDGEHQATVHAFMAHHEGMTLVAIAEQLVPGRMIDRFHAEPIVKATEMLLQERVPPDIGTAEPVERDVRRQRPVRVPTRKDWHPFDPAAAPRVDLLSNGRYAVMISAAGGGYSRWGDLAITRWREDPTLDGWGQFCYVREVGAAESTSTTYQPTLTTADADSVHFSIARAELRRMHNGIELHTTVVVSTEDDAEIRTVTLTNYGTRARDVELTSYAELVLATAAADAAHPAFGNLSVELEHVPGRDALLATRRLRAPDDQEVWAIHMCSTDGKTTGAVEYEGDRARFLGRGRSARAPRALNERLSNTVGAVLDPIFSIRRRVQLPPRQAVRVRWLTAAASTREAALALADKYATTAAAERAAALAWTHAQAQLHYLDVDPDEASVFLEIAARLLYSSRQLRARDEIIARNRLGQAGLWPYGISGDRPILLLRVNGAQHNELLREALRAHEYFCLRGLSVDLVVLNEQAPSYSQWANDQLLAIVRSSPGAHLVDRPGGMFVRRSDVMPADDVTLLLAAARVVFVGDRGSIVDQLAVERVEAALPATITNRSVAMSAVPASPALRFDNGIGGFSPDGREYRMRLGGGRVTAAPWCNVIANERFGTLVSERGGGYEWADNCHENRITAWSNDAVVDPPTSAIFVRDDATGAWWAPQALSGDSPEQSVRHGQGYTIFSGEAQDIAHTLTVFVPSDDPVRISRLVLENRGSTPRRLSVIGYFELTLGVLRENAAPYVVTNIDERDGFLVARNTYPGDLGQRVCFVDSTPRFRSVTADRLEFLGRNGDPARPAALSRASLSGRIGTGFDPCAAMQIEVTLAAGEKREVVLVLGQTPDLNEARAIVTRLRASGAAESALTAVHAKWDRLLGAIEIDTPDDAANILVNRWLLYQVVSARLWARTGFYQSGGAYGFRDQLQDVASLLYTAPGLAREQIVRAAAKQFREGDVLHWWHPPLGRGVRTRISDDYLWLPVIVCRYVEVTGDVALLDEQLPFVEARALADGEHEAYLLPTQTQETATLYEHCARAADHALTVGVHGLPLMGGGDWNDGMNRVGVLGRGESVWLGWFVIDALRKLAPLAEQRGDTERFTRWRDHAESLRASVEREAWDGAWYRRAYFDDGTPLGTAEGVDCQIDSLSQTWSVLSGAGDPARSAQAMAEVDKRLVENNLVKLLTPPFDRAPIDPGYIRGYLPGVRENGGQYTHAAAWVIQAHAQLGNGDRAGELLRTLNPILHTSTAEGAARYRVEPYVLAGDVYSVAPHIDRGGWTWYTGSASWLYRAVVESMLGFHKRGTKLTINPCIPRAWPRFSLTYRFGGATYRIVVLNPDGVMRGVKTRALDGTAVDGAIDLVDDGREHALEIVLGPVAR